MKKIIFLHGFGSSGATKTVEYLRSKLIDAEVISPDIPLEPEEAMSMLNRLCYEEKPDVIIGTSMGAMYAQQLHGYRKILVNPAFHLSEIMRSSLGVNKFMHLRADGSTEFVINESLCQAYEDMEKTQFLGITKFDKKHTYAFFGTGDTLVNGYDEYLQYYGNATQYPGEHALLQKWVKAYILPCVLQLLSEEEDTENIDAVRTNELLRKISEGGRLGRLAYEELWKGSYINYCELANQHMDLFDPLEVIQKGFRMAVNNFVFDYESTHGNSFAFFSYYVIQNRLEDAEKQKYFQTMVDKGRKMEPMQAMQLLTDYYIDNCGVSLGERTIAYYAGSEWLLRYIEKHPDDKRWSDNTHFMDVMPVISDRFTKEHAEKYDISIFLGEGSERSLTMRTIENIDSETAAALCWGINRMCKVRGYSFFYMLIKVIVGEEDILDLTDRAIFLSLEEAETEMRKWTELNREHVLCYIIKEIPRGKQYNDGLSPAVCCQPDVPYWDDNDYTEHVYMPSGLKQKQDIKVGSVVDYISYDKDLTTLECGCVAKLPNDDDTGMLILAGQTRLEGLSQEAQIATSVKVPARYVFARNKETKK